MKEFNLNMKVTAGETLSADELLKKVLITINDVSENTPIVIRDVSAKETIGSKIKRKMAK